MPILSGRIIELHPCNIHRTVNMKYKETKHKNNHGNIEVPFYNAIFNSTGFMTHDRTIAEYDLNVI